MSQSGKSSGGGLLRWAVVGFVFAVLAVTFSESLRDRVLDALFGAEEEFEYEPSLNGSGNPAHAVAEPAGDPSQN